MDLVAILVERLEEMVAGFIRALPQFGLAIFVLILTWGAANVVRGGVRRMTERTRLRASLAALLVTMSGIFVWTFGILVALAVILPGVDAASLLAVLGLGSVAIGFAFKDIFENFLAGVLIMLRKKMRIGDVIHCEEVEGRVEMITLRETYLRRLDNELTIVPNSYLFKNPVRIVTDAGQRRHEIVVGVAYDTDLDRAADAIEKAVRSASEVDRDKAVEVYAREFNESSIDFTVRWWSGAKPVDMHRSRDEVVRKVKRALDEAGIEIPFPQRVHWFKEPLQTGPAPGARSRAQDTASDRGEDKSPAPGRKPRKSQASR